MASLSALQTRIAKATELLPSPYLIFPHDGEVFLSLEDAKTRLQDYLFTQVFALMVEQNEKQRKTVLFDCLRHHKKQQNTSEVEEKDRQRPNTKASFLDCNYRIRISLPLLPRSEVWLFTITHSEHNHKMNPYLFCSTQHKNKDQDRDNTLLPEVGLRTAGMKFFYFIYVIFCVFLLIYT